MRAEHRDEFRAKSAVHQTIDTHDARLARAVRECLDLPGHKLFQYRDDRGMEAIGPTRQPVSYNPRLLRPEELARAAASD